jgi:hypothetical protein
VAYYYIVTFEARRKTMRKAIIGLFAFLVMFGFAVSGVMAQMVNWDAPRLITNAEQFDGIAVNPETNLLEGFVGTTPYTITFTEDIPNVQATDTTFETPEVDSAESPNGVVYAIDTNTVGVHVTGNTYISFPVTEQPKVPAEGTVPMTGVYRFIAAGPDGRLYILFEDTDGTGLGDQYILVGNPAQATVKITPRSLNQNSKGQWVTVKISGLPEGYAVGDINLNTVCVTAVDADYTIEPVCQASGPSNNRSKKKVMLKLDRQELIGAIPDVTGTVELTVIGTVGEAALPFVAIDTIKTKAPKITE